MPSLEDLVSDDMLQYVVESVKSLMAETGLDFGDAFLNALHNAISLDIWSEPKSEAGIAPYVTQAVDEMYILTDPTVERISKSAIKNRL